MCHEGKLPGLVNRWRSCRLGLLFYFFTLMILINVTLSAAAGCNSQVPHVNHSDNTSLTRAAPSTIPLVQAVDARKGMELIMGTHPSLQILLEKRALSTVPGLQEWALFGTKSTGPKTKSPAKGSRPMAEPSWSVHCYQGGLSFLQNIGLLSSM